MIFQPFTKMKKKRNGIDSEIGVYYTLTIQELY